MKEVKVRFTGDDASSRMIQDAITKAHGNLILEVALKQYIQNAVRIGLAARLKASN